MSFLARFFIRLSARRVGEDATGNSYWEAKRALRDGRPKRFVIYAGEAEASVVPPAWWGWLHHTTALPLPETLARDWQKPHLPNLTGSAAAYRPQGSDLRLGVPASPAGAYQAWTPGA
ncbi:NADH-ubiquinone oxidoreductase subunit NDUFA12 family protein [Plastoroseomonas arctica]|uniref:NADH:ubiquinone oxidoreductase subunit NDUFA12 n=1 Tax=Plastoroseomonas arctica TaxID=1509237 RepID=A0AAF1K0W5_9PROT|nr:NADH-ubiquinone oxidoreductase subunit NDUFA12 family protein [Plastoroseomonas arctica]MBR0654260.1 NADH:ubiquinone oxidoreductase subunit NDUFA12 [Plastoroseomonas arctica]